MPERPPNESAQAPPQRDILREARRLARLRHLRLVASNPQVGHAQPAPGPKEAA